MNGVVVDIKGNRAALLTEDGAVRKVPNRGYAIGDTVSWQKGEIVSVRRVLRRAAAAAAALVAVMGIGAGTAYAIPYGTVSVDINPSIEYTVNIFDYVLSVKGVNEDGEAVLSELDTGTLKHRPIAKAVESTLLQIESDGFFEQQGADVLIAVATPSAAHAEKLRSDLEKTTARDMDLPTRSVTVTPEDVTSAHESGMTAGRQWERQEREKQNDRGTDRAPGQPTEPVWPDPFMPSSPDTPYPGQQEPIPEGPAPSNPEKPDEAQSGPGEGPAKSPFADPKEDLRPLFEEEMGSAPATAPEGPDLGAAEPPEDRRPPEDRNGTPSPALDRPAASGEG